MCLEQSDKLSEKVLLPLDSEGGSAKVISVNTVTSSHSLSFTRARFCIVTFCVSQALCSCSHSGAFSQEERETRDGGERDPEYQETLGQNGLQRPS